LEATKGDLPANSTRKRQVSAHRKDRCGQGRFRRLHAADRMATDKLKEGIEGSRPPTVKLETMLAARLARNWNPETAAAV